MLPPEEQAQADAVLKAMAHLIQKSRTTQKTSQTTLLVVVLARQGVLYPRHLLLEQT
jgi:hypothetical protein